MGKMIFTAEKCKNPKKKPGWQKAAQEEAEWLARINGTKLFVGPARKFGGKVQHGVKLSPVKDGTLPTITPKIGQSLGMFVKDGGTKVVPRPEILYKEDPEMLARELKARERKFAVAPAYNKGNDILVTDEMMKDITAGKTRRR